MNSVNKPKRALLAYCALAERISGSNGGMFGALAPFFSPVCRELAGQMFDAQTFSNEVAKLYGLKIPRLAVLGLAEQLEAQGLLVSMLGKARAPVYQYAPNIPNDEREAPGVTEREIDSVLNQFVDSCRDDPLFAKESKEVLEGEFLDRLLNADSMRLLARKEIGEAQKSTSKTLSIKRQDATNEDHRELHLDFHVAQFLLDLRDREFALFERVSDIAFASMAAEAIACFSEPAVNQTNLGGLEIYLDSPILLDILGVNVEYAAYGAEILEMIMASGARPVIFDDGIAEAESVVGGRLASLRSGSARASTYMTSAKPHVLSALKDNIGSRASSLGIAVKKDPQTDLVRRSRDTVGDIEADLGKRMAHWPNQEAKVHDQRSVWAMIRIRDANTLCERICDSKAVFVTRNTPLAHMANGSWKTWLRNAAKQSNNAADRWAPIALSDKQLAGYLWLRSGEGNGRITKSRLLAHCSAAIRPRPDVKARAINLVLEMHGKSDADHVAALLEDREGERALMRASWADPEDVTAERLPYIIEQVKLAAGEFAAAKAREEADRKLASLVNEKDQQLAEIKNDYEQQLRNLEAQQEKSKEISENNVKELKAELTQRHQDALQVEARLNSLNLRVQAQEFAEKETTLAALTAGLTNGLRVYRRLRYLIVLLFASIVTWATAALGEWPEILQLVSFFVTAAGFWFVPNFLEYPTRWEAMREIRRRALQKAPRLTMPSTKPNFDDGTWDAIENLRLELNEQLPK